MIQRVIIITQISCTHFASLPVEEANRIYYNFPAIVSNNEFLFNLLKRLDVSSKCKNIAELFFFPAIRMCVYVRCYYNNLIPAPSTCKRLNLSDVVTDC